jgi:predicted DNA-binding transcriptional regulator YafY
VAKSEGRPEPRIYALDERMIDVVQTKKALKVPARFKADEFFSNYFGIIVGDDYKPQEIKIRVEHDQVKYFESLPLHESQQRVEEESTPEHTVFRHHLAPTYDFKQELLSRGPAVEVLSPESFRQEIIDDITNMAKRYWGGDVTEYSSFDEMMKDISGEDGEV